MSKKQFSAVILIIVLLLAVAVVAIFVLLDKPDAKQKTGSGKTVAEMINSEEDEVIVTYNGKQYRRDKNAKGYLLLGIDRMTEAVASGSYNGGGQSDVMIVAVVNDEKEEFTLLQIDRDTMAAVNILGVRGDVVGWRTEQIALAHAHGSGMQDSCKNAMDAVSGFLYGTKLEGYASLRMGAISILNDLVGGITVKIEDDFSQIDPSLVMGEEITLKGEQAYHYIRYRIEVGDGTNVSRMRRHRTYLSALGDKLEEKMAADKNSPVKIYEEISPYVVTDIGSKTATNIAEKIRGYKNNGIVTFSGENKMGEKFMEFYPDQDNVKEIVLDLFYTEIT